MRTRSQALCCMPALLGALLLTSAAFAQVQPIPQPGRTDDPLNPPPQFKPPPLTETVRPLRFAVLPPRSTPLLARIPLCDTPAGETVLTCVRGPVDAGPIDGSIPPAEWTIETTGGTHPITLSLGTQPAALADRFEIAMPPTELTIVRDDPRAAFEEAQKRGKPAANLRRIIRFKGLPAGAELPLSITVIVTARDILGDFVGTDFRVYPYSPRLTNVTGHEGRVALQSVTMRLQFDGLGSAETMRPINTRELGCRWWELSDQIRLGSTASTTNLLRIAAIDLGARPVSIFRQGAFTTEGACNFRFDARLTFPLMVEGQQTPFVSMRSPQPITLAGRQLYRVTSTSQLRDRFNWFEGRTSKIGVCSGKSETPHGSFPVGRLESNNDLSFVIRSGPLGTDCIFHHLDAVSLPDGFVLVNSDWTTSVTEKCRVLDEDGSSGNGVVSYTFDRQPWTFAPGLADFRGFSGPLVSGGITLLDSANPSNRLRAILRPVQVHLKCDNTVLNDHSVRLTLDQVTFSGPPGLAFP